MGRASRASKWFFVSHISEEAEVARLVREQMEKDFIEHVKFFTSSEVGHVEAGREWLTSIQRALKKSAALLVLCSRSSVSRPWVQFELGAAWIRRMRIIPICHSGIEVDDLPMPLLQLHGVQLGTEKGIQSLYRAIADELGWPKSPAPSDLPQFFGRLNKLESSFQQSNQQYERYIDILLPPPGTLPEARIPEAALVESNKESLAIFRLAGERRTWGDICRAAERSRDTRWLGQLQQSIYDAGHDRIFQPVQAIYHAQDASYQPQLARKEMQPGGSCRYHVHFVETTVAPLTDVDNDFGLLATLLRLGLRFRYQVIEHYQREFGALKASPAERQPDIEKNLMLLRRSIEVIEIDALSRGAQNFSPGEIVNLFDREADQVEMVQLQEMWKETRSLLFRTDPPLTRAEIVGGIAKLREMNYRFSCLATKRFHEMVHARWGTPRKPVHERVGLAEHVV